MTATHEQRRQLVYDNAALIHQWLLLMDEAGQIDLLRSMVKEYSLPDLRKMNSHVKERLAAAQEASR